LYRALPREGSARGSLCCEEDSLYWAPPREGGAYVTVTRTRYSFSCAEDGLTGSQDKDVAAFQAEAAARGVLTHT
jgi:hypothetical protein